MKRPHVFKKGDLVFWADPDNSIASGFGTVHSIQDNSSDCVIGIVKDDGGYAEVMPHELVTTPNKTPLQGSVQ
jgi:hypothetical protein